MNSALENEKRSITFQDSIRFEPTNEMKYTAVITSAIVIMSHFMSYSQEVPRIYSNITKDGNKLFFSSDSKTYEQAKRGSGYTLDQMVNAPSGTPTGIAFDFKDSTFNGTVYYGFINMRDEAYPLPVYFKKTVRIRAGIGELNLLDMGGKYDMISWENTNKGLLGYRVMNSRGILLYDGRIAFEYDGEFEVKPTIIEGPSLHRITPTSATVRIVLNKAAATNLWINKKIIPSDKALVHEIEVTSLEPSNTYRYEFEGLQSRIFSLTTAPVKGSKEAFTFSYASDSRNGQGGGERNLYGTNAYIVNRIMAFNKLRGAKFMQFSGDLINGYLTDEKEQNLQYANWKRALEPYGHYLPVYVGMGNHEALLHVFKGEGEGVGVDKFPFETQSAEAVFRDNFCNPTSELKSEDGSKYDPNPGAIDFPGYEETVFSYTYGNVAVIVMNSNYWYAPMAHANPKTSGNIHAYIMDNQLEWFRKEVAIYESDKAIQHVFVTLHTPFFPNGGHVQDDMWYRGNNDPRPFVAGKPVEKGIIERRDQLLDIMVNQSQKVKAVLTGDEHNYAKTLISGATAKYPMNWSKDKLELKRSIWQINNGSAGAPYYAQEKTPWTQMVSKFSTQNVVVLFHVQGPKLKMEVVNPLTFEKVDELEFE